MRTIRTLLLATAALALTTGTAAAQEGPVEVVKQEHCNPCVLHVIGTSSLTGHMLGLEIGVSACDNEMLGEIYDDGTGQITDIALTGPNCNSVPCTTGGIGDPWPFVIGDLASGEEHADVDFCLFGPDGSKQHCEVELELHDTGDHHYVLSVDDHTCPSGVELSGDWEIESDGVGDRIMLFTESD